MFLYCVRGTCTYKWVHTKILKKLRTHTALALLSCNNNNFPVTTGTLGFLIGKLLRLSQKIRIMEQVQYYYIITCRIIKRHFHPRPYNSRENTNDELYTNRVVFWRFLRTCLHFTIFKIISRALMRFVCQAFRRPTRSMNPTAVVQYTRTDDAWDRGGMTVLV